MSVHVEDTREVTETDGKRENIKKRTKLLTSGCMFLDERLYGRLVVERFQGLCVHTSDE